MEAREGGDVVNIEDDEKGVERRLNHGNCGIYAEDSYFHPEPDNCYDLGDTWWNDKVTWIRASESTCVEVWEHHDGGTYHRYCGSDWEELGWDLSGLVSRVCCSSDWSSSSSSSSSPVNLCTGNGGACGCGESSDGASKITMNRFWGDDNDEKVYGCGGAFRLDAVSWDAQWDGALSGTFGTSFIQDASLDGWEGCCWICGVNLQMAGKLSDGWYCEKDFFSTGIWLKGTNK